MSKPVVRIEIEDNDGEAKQFTHVMKVNGGTYGQLFESFDEAAWHVDGLVRALTESGCQVASSTVKIDNIKMRSKTSAEKKNDRVARSAGPLLNAAKAAYRLLPGLIPAARYMGERRKRQFSRIEEVFDLLEGAIDKAEGNENE